MASYEFVPVWRFAAPLERVWDELYHPDRWPGWWRAVKAVELLQLGDELGVGARRRYTWRGVLPYELTFEMRTTLVEPYARLEGVATGELSGVGRWKLSPDVDDTVVRYEWTVEASKRWMRFLSPLARSVFEWNHNVVMRWGYNGLDSVVSSGSKSRA